jgi:hypothetical protein
VLSIGLLCLMGGVASADSGLPATLGMEPATAGPGAQVEVSGLDFPAGESVDLQVATSAGPVHLATVTVADGGYFRQPVTLPADAPTGAWELRATAADGTTAVHVFETGPAPIIAEPAAPPADTASATTTPVGNSPTDIMVMLTFALLIAAVGGALAYAWYLTHDGSRQPGMGAGDDPIWSNAGEEPIWSAATLDAPR